MAGVTWPATGAPLPSISKGEAEEFYMELLSRYRDPLFQIDLAKVFRTTDPRQLGYSIDLSNLFRPVRDDLLARFGFPTGEVGDVAMALALGELLHDADIKCLLRQVDEHLYRNEAPIIAGSTSLTKRQVIEALRLMIAAFRSPDLHRTMLAKKAASILKCRDLGFSLDGRRPLALERQGPILARFGLPASARGMHMFQHMAAQHIMDPDVSVLIAAVNTLLGLDEEECSEFNTRLEDISMHDPCPRIADPFLRAEAVDNMQFGERRSHHSSSRRSSSGECMRGLYFLFFCLGRLEWPWRQ